MGTIDIGNSSCYFNRAIQVWQQLDEGTAVSHQQNGIGRKECEGTSKWKGGDS